ncbi:MAG: ATP-binding cassette domain-containing protein [Candidatus Pacebacteria bacterium]|nr:ATP-binding cassette domain-containing protein [Candidatus Paceibacterota bacterium]PIR60493.1 MAG: cell division ATP-binding protein FtsE [Candidatus Pacebacteria bacterium CG10_big_fil_rev_8_21_14_0_10_44_54]
MIRFQDVSKEFSANNFAIKEVSFSVEPGEFVYITGASGSGKTTLMRLIIREYTPTSGQISLFGDALTSISSKKITDLRRKIGVVFQDYKLLPELNVWENIALPLEIVNQPQAEIENRVTDLLKLIDLLDKPYLFPSQLSGGEAQRVGIARALALGPDLIFADEPTGNLDVNNARSIVELLQKINKLGTTILFATHNLDLTKNDSARILKLANGNLVNDSKPPVKKEAPKPNELVKASEPPKKKEVEKQKLEKKPSLLSRFFSKEKKKKEVEHPKEKIETPKITSKEKKIGTNQKKKTKKERVIVSEENLE